MKVSTAHCKGCFEISSNLSSRRFSRVHSENFFGLVLSEGQDSQEGMGSKDSSPAANGYSCEKALALVSTLVKAVERLRAVATTDRSRCGIFLHQVLLRPAAKENLHREHGPQKSAPEITAEGHSSDKTFLKTYCRAPCVMTAATRSKHHKARPRRPQLWVRRPLCS